MLILPEFHKDLQSKNTVYLIKSTKELDSLDLSKKQISYVKAELANGNSCSANSYGKYLAVFQYSKLKDSFDNSPLFLLLAVPTSTGNIVRK